MIDWEELQETEDLDELKQAKLWLFRENMRLKNERDELEHYREQFLGERTRLLEEIATLNKKTILERKRLKQESLFFDKKIEILKDGFRQLEEDRRTFEAEKRKFSVEKDRGSQRILEEDSDEAVAEVLFRNTQNPLALRKRYRDLIKIFHPDNLFGDAELARQINREFMRRRKQE